MDSHCCVCGEYLADTSRMICPNCEGKTCRVEIKLKKRLPNLSPEEEQIFTEAIVEAYQRGRNDALNARPDHVKCQKRRKGKNEKTKNR